MQFVRKILSLLKKEDVTLNFNCDKLFHPTWGWSSNWDPIKRMMELLAPKTNKLDIWEENMLNFPDDFGNFNNKFPEFIFRLQSINIFVHWGDHLGLLVDWLTTPMDDYKQKTLDIQFGSNGFAQELISDIKEVGNGKIFMITMKLIRI